MTSKQPPRVAAWMLKHFGSGPNNQTLLGDLAEQHLQKKNSTWYWRQAMKAIPVGLFREIQANPHIAVRALLTGWTTWIAGAALIFPLVFYGTNFGFAFESRDLIGSARSFMWMPVLGQASFHNNGPWATPVSFLIAVAMPLIVGIVCGWLVARLHREQQTSVVLLFAGSIVLTNLLLVGSFVLQVGPRVAYIFSGLLAAFAVASVLGILCGGGLFRDRSRAVSN